MSKRITNVDQLVVGQRYTFAPGDYWVFAVPEEAFEADYLGVQGPYHQILLDDGYDQIFDQYDLDDGSVVITTVEEEA